MLLGVLGVGALAMGCDQGPSAPDGLAERPLVSQLAVQPDSVNAADLADDQVQDSLAHIAVDIEARVTDPDGQVERAVFTIEPSTNPRATATGRLTSRGQSVYGRQIALQIPAYVSEVYTVRVFAVDRDSLTSNQALGQFRFVGKE